MSEPFIAEIRMFGGNFAPAGWAFCDGQLLAINSYQALFSLLGTTFGGDGETTFGLPDLRGRIPMHPGNGPGLTPRDLGDEGGTENVTLNVNQIPAHAHTATPIKLRASANPADTGDPTGTALGMANVYKAEAPTAELHADSITGGNTNNTGGSQAHTNVQPFQCVNFIMALQGTFPSPN